MAILLVTSILALSVSATENKPATKKVCVDIQDRKGKPVIDPKTKKPKQDCKEVKVRQKHQGTKIDEVKKK